MSDDLTTTLYTHFGFDSFRPGQAEAIQYLLTGDHTLVVMPTGAGKSLIYQLAALRRPGLTLVISPLIALMKDQVDSLKSRRIPVTYINSTLSIEEQAHRLQAMANGTYRLVYVSPERLRHTAFREILGQTTIGLLAVDEAHCISQWGHDFRPDYLRIGTARAEIGGPVTAALTATATPQVQADIVQKLGLPSARRVITGFNRPNLAFEVRYAAAVPAKLTALQALLAELRDGTGIIYTGTRRDAEEVAEFTRDVGLRRAEHYHAGLDAETRTRVQNAFIAGELPVVVATNAFGMGIDRPDVRLVAHYAMPGTLEAYYQEAGRAGRDGSPARAVLLYAPQDRALQEWFIENDAPSPKEVRSLYDAVRGINRDEVWLTTEDLSLASGLPEVKLKVGLAQLETAGGIQRLGDAGPRMLLRLGPWDEAAVQAATAGVEARRTHRRQQLAQMVAYAESNVCRRRILLDHFGDRGPAEAPICCDNCAQRNLATVSRTTTKAGDQESPDGTFTPLQPGSSAAVPLAILDALRRLRWEVGRTKLAQILKGSKAKDLRQFDYDRSPYYGRLAVLRIRDIEDLIGQLVAQGYLKVVGGEMPVLKLTPQGEAAIKSRAAIPLDLPREIRPEQVARKREEHKTSGTVEASHKVRQPPQARAQRVVKLGDEGSVGSVPELIAALTDSDGNVRRLAASALGKIGDRRAVEPLTALLACEAMSQVRQYAVKALGKIGDGRARALLEQIAANGGERDYTRTAAQIALHRLSSQCPDLATNDAARESARKPPDVADDAVEAFLSRPHPRPLPGPWQTGWALGFHSRFAGADWSRSPAGELAFRLKYRSDTPALSLLVEQILALRAEHPELTDVDALVPVPPSTPRPDYPVYVLAEALGGRLGLPIWQAVVKTRETAPQKEMHTLAQKRVNVAGAFVVRGDVWGKRLLVIDDLYDSGATLEEVTRILRKAGATRLCVLTLTRTIHSDA